ncbi:MAG: serine hydrolase [Ferruginibacter sp.]|nr:serine hydrolase [Ferruginibacter sp.]
MAISCSPAKKIPAAPPVTTVPTPATPTPVIPVVKANDAGDVFFENIFKNYPGVFNDVLAKRQDLNVQIIYTEINRDKNGNPSFQQHFFNKSNARYFYPASTVKFPVALLALQRLNELADKGINRNSTMITEAAYGGQTAVYNEPNSPDGRPTIANYIKKIFLVSDNDAFNRLYEFLGQEYINDELHKKGFKDVAIQHRLNIFLSEDENRHTNPINFYDSNMRLLFAQPMQFNKKAFAKRTDSIGKAHYAGGQLVNRPMDFSKKNRLELQDLNAMLTGLIFPNSVKPNQRFNLTEDDRRFVMQYMSQFPGETVYPAYDSSYQDSYIKHLLYGNMRGSLPKNIRIFNKSGTAYGQLVDAAYIVDYEKNIEFIVSAAILCNTDNVMNDDKYDYETIGLPFMKNLGRALYDYELKRKRVYQPDLSVVKFSYDK